jgi:hypothetical protein
MVWQDRFGGNGAPLFGSADFDLDATAPNFGAGDQNGDGILVDALLASNTQSIGAKMWGLAENLNTTVVNDGGFGIAIHMMWNSPATFAQYIANTVSHEIAHTYGLNDAYTTAVRPYFAPNTAGANTRGNAKPYDIMMAGSPGDPNLTFRAQNIQLLQAAMGVSRNSATALLNAVQQYRDTIGLPGSVNGVRENVTEVAFGQSVPVGPVEPGISLTNGEFAVFDQGSDFIGSTAADGANGQSITAGYTIENVGYGPLTISGLSFAMGGQGFSVVDTGLLGSTIGSGGSAELLVRFDPATAGDFSDILCIASNASKRAF